MADATEPKPPRKAGLIPWAIAATLAIAAIWMAQRDATSRAEAAVLRQQQAFADVGFQNLTQQLEAERILSARQLAMLREQRKAHPDLADLRLAVLGPTRANSDEALAIALWDAAKQEGVVFMERAPALPAGQRFELWLIEQSETAAPVSAGVLGFNAKGGARVRFKPATPAGAVTAIAVSREHDDGSPAHRQPAELIMRGTLR